MRMDGWKLAGRKMGAAAAVMAFLAVGMFAGVRQAAACSPAPWTFTQASESAVAAVQGVADQVSADGRTATLEVLAYAGPDKAPKSVQLPATVDSREGKDGAECPDFSVKFEQGQAYVVLLADIAPQTKLAFPQWITAFPVQGDQLVVAYPKNETAPVAQQLQQFAQVKGTAVQYPTQLSPVWYAPGGRSGFAAVGIGLAVLVVAGGAALWARSRKRPPAGG